jgi:hypothetical protein
MEKKKTRSKTMTKPKGMRGITVNDHLYYWCTYGPSQAPGLSGIVIRDSATSKRYEVKWEDVTNPLYYPIMPRHVAAWIEGNLSEKS